MEERAGGERVKVERPLSSVLVWPVRLDEAVDMYAAHAGFVAKTKEDKGWGWGGGGGWGIGAELQARAENEKMHK